MADANTPTLPKDSGKELGASGTYIFSGWISGEEYNMDLQGKNALQQYDVMRRSDPTVHAALIVCKNPVIGAKWDIEPASDDPTDIEAAAFAKRELLGGRNVNWRGTVRESLTCLDFGHAVAEIVYDITEFEGKTRIGLGKIASRKQRSIMRWQTTSGDDGITQINPTGPLIDIPRNKLVYIINEQEGENYEGISLLRFAYKPWKIKDALELMNAVALERMAIGVPIVTKGNNNETISEPELVKLRRALREIRANEEAYIEVPNSVTVGMLDMKAQTTKDVLPTINHADTQITLSVLAQFLMLGSNGGTGSRAVSQDHSALFMKSLDAVASTIQQAFQTDVINRLIDLNYTNLQNGYPRLVYSNLSDDDVKNTGDAVSALMTAGALTADPGLENRLRQGLQLPDLPEDMVENYQELKKPATPLSPFGIPPADTPAKDANSGKDNKESISDAEDKTQASIIADAKKVRKILINYISED